MAPDTDKIHGKVGREQWKAKTHVLHQIRMRAHHPQRQSIHLMQMLPRMIAIQTLLSCHRLARRAERPRRAERDEDVQRREGRDGGAVRGVLAAAGVGQEREKRFETLLERAGGLGDEGGYGDECDVEGGETHDGGAGRVDAVTGMGG